MTRMVIFTKVYEVRQSAKGWRETYQMFFNKDRALNKAQELQQEYSAQGLKINVRVYEHNCGDIIAYNEEME